MSIGNGFPWRRITMYMRENGRIRDMLSPTNNMNQPKMTYISLEENSALLHEKDKEICLLKEQNEELYKVAKEWMNDYDKLKNKYEPMIAVTS